MTSKQINHSTKATNELDTQSTIANTLVELHHSCPQYLKPATVTNSIQNVDKLDISNKVSLQDIVSNNGDTYCQSSDNKFVVGIVTNVVRNNQNNITSYFANFYNKQNEKKKTTKTFDRMIFFMDVFSLSGQCGVIIYNNNDKAHQSLSLVISSDNAVLPGTAIAIMEPTYEKLYLGDNNDMPILLDDDMKSIIPLDMKENKWIWQREFPISTLITDVGTRAFLYKKVFLKLNHVQIVKSNCTGQLCDRIHKEDGSTSCFCFSTPHTQSLVLSCNVFVYNNLDLDNSTHFIHVNRHFQSYRFTMLLTDRVIIDTTMIADETQKYQPKLRLHVSAYVKYVNEHGGWTIMGWYRNALKQDANVTTDDRKSKSDDNKNKILSEEVEPHIVRLVPNEYPFTDYPTNPFTFD